MFALLRTCANIVSFLLVTKNETGAERVPVWEASEKCSATHAAEPKIFLRPKRNTRGGRVRPAETAVSDPKSVRTKNY